VLVDRLDRAFIEQAKRASRGLILRGSVCSLHGQSREQIGLSPNLEWRSWFHEINSLFFMKSPA